MSDPKVTYYDLRAEALAGALPQRIGHRSDAARLSRAMMRRINSNAVVLGPSGSGKTAFVYGWVRGMLERHDTRAFLQLDTQHLSDLAEAGNDERYLEALLQLPPCVLFIDDAGRHLCRNGDLLARLFRIYRQVLAAHSMHLIIAAEAQQWETIAREFPPFAELFEPLALKPQTRQECGRILRKRLPQLNSEHAIVPDAALNEIVVLAERFPSLGRLPRSAIRLLDESLALCAERQEHILTADIIAEATEAKTGVPRGRFGKNELAGVKKLEDTLNRRVISQEAAIAKVAATLQRGTLGLRDPDRTLGSFLLLGPSGVGKTETAKSVADTLFGDEGSFIRFDMSEFQLDHTVQRLLGAPAGYIGYEEGGALTNALRQHPYSLVLLDEIEKAHPKIFDIFLQVLDDGRLSAGDNETIDARHAVFMATSNVGVPEILEACAAGVDVNDPAFVKERLMPVLSRTFRLEFLNRFDSILIFRPLSLPALLDIAELEIKKAEVRLARHRVRFSMEPRALKAQLERLADPRFGARPVKRFIEETCETLLMRSLLAAGTREKL